MHRLDCHPAFHTTAVRGIEAGVRRQAGGALGLCFVLTGDVAHIAMPAAREPQRKDELWRHTCFECFMRASGDAYLEFNFSPSREWAAYAFHSYRVPAPLPPAYDPCFVVSRDSDALRLEATIPAAALAHVADPWRMGLSAVVEEASGALTYWALRHAPGKPDFHHAEAFAIEL
jgi:hypothetical protein